LKFTGMPAWPSQHRDDEVWAMVAFLLELPKLDAGAYENLVQGNATKPNPAETINLTPPVPEIPSSIAQMCARCHGREGEGRGDGAYPQLAGQRRDYLLNTLTAYSRGARHSGIMEPVAAGLTEKLIRDLSGYYAGLEARSGERTVPADVALWERGRQIAEEGLPKKRVPSCIECHGPKGTRTKPAYPSLNGLSADYLVLQLKLFKEKQRGGTAYAHLMQEVVDGLEPEDMRAAAEYFESLAPDPAR
jgi:cytochrome c553